MNDRSLTGLNGGDPTGGTPGATTSTDKFNLALMGILRQAQESGSTAPLYASKDRLQNEKLNLSNPLGDTPYAPLFQGMGYASTAAEKDTQNAFNPGITSIESQIQSANDAATKFTEMANTAENIAQNSKNIVAPGQTIVDNSGKVIYQGHSYTPTPNPTTGTIDGFDQTTGKWLSDVQNTTKQNTPPPAAGDNVLVGGVDFSGASTGGKPYAKDPNYSTEVNGIYQALQKGMPVPNAPALDTYIQSHAKGSGVTGSMIMNAATTYGIDPTALASVLAQESDFGTAGAGAKTNNPGNVGNTDGGVTTSFPSIQKGVNAAAAELAKRMPGNVNAGKPSGSLSEAGPTKSTSTVGGTFSPTASTKLTSLSAGVKPYVDAGPQGVAYINDDRVPADLKAVAQMQAAKAGIPYLQAADAQALKSIGVVYQALDSMQTLADKNLSSGVTGTLKDSVLGAGAKLFGTDWGGNLKLFDSYRDTAIKAVQALAGGAGSGLRINGSEIEANMSNLPSSNENLETATKQLAQMKSFLDRQLAATFPYISENSSTGAGKTTSGVTKSGISYTVQ